MPFKKKKNKNKREREEKKIQHSGPSLFYWPFVFHFIFIQTGGEVHVGQKPCLAFQQRIQSECAPATETIKRMGIQVTSNTLEGENAISISGSPPKKFIVCVWTSTAEVVLFSINKSKFLPLAVRI